MRNEVEANIAKDNTVGEDLEVRNAAIAASVIMRNSRGDGSKDRRIYTVVNQEWHCVADSNLFDDQAGHRCCRPVREGNSAH